MKPHSMEEKISYRLFLMGFLAAVHRSTVHLCLSPGFYRPGLG